MYVKVGDTVEVIHQMNNRGIVKKIYYIKVTAGAIGGSFSKRRRIIFESDLDGRMYDMLLSNLRLVRE